MKNLIKSISLFIRINLFPVISVFIGILLGYFHWFIWGCYWGTYPSSSECWVNCSYGGLFLGFIMPSFCNKKRSNRWKNKSGDKS